MYMKFVQDYMTSSMDASLQHTNILNQIADPTDPLFAASWPDSQIASGGIASASFYQHNDYQLASPADAIREEASLLETYHGDDIKEEHTFLRFKAHQLPGYGYWCDLPGTPERSNSFAGNCMSAFADQDSSLLVSNTVIAYPGPDQRCVHPESGSMLIDKRGVRSVEVGCGDQQYLNNLQLFAAPRTNEIKKRPRESSTASSNLTSTIKESKRVHKATGRDDSMNKPALSADCTSISSGITKLFTINSTTSCKLSGEISKSRHSSLGPALNTTMLPRAPHGSISAQTVAARNRRERINARLKTLQELVPNGSKVDLVTMLEKAINYVKFLQLQLRVLSNDQYWHEDEEFRMATLQEDGGEGDVAKPRELAKKSKADTMSSCCSS